METMRKISRTMKMRRQMAANQAYARQNAQRFVEQMRLDELFNTAEAILAGDAELSAVVASLWANRHGYYLVPKDMAGVYGVRS